MVQKLTGLDRFMRFNLAEMENPAPITVVVSTTDRFKVKKQTLYSLVYVTLAE